MRATLHDPRGPLWLRFAPYVLGLVVGLTPLFADLDDALGPMLFVSGLLFASGSFFPSRFGKRGATLETGAGYVDVKGAGLLSQRIRAKDVTGASTALVDDHYTVALARSRRGGIPVTLELATMDDVRKVREALAVGHDGYGTILWPVGPGGNERHDRRLSVVTVALGFLLTLAALFDVDGAGPLLFAIFAFVGLLVITLLLRFASRRDVPPYVAMRADGLHVFKNGDWKLIPYAHIAHVEDHDKSFSIYLHGGPPPVEVDAPPARLFARGLSRAERKQVVAQILSAAQRAQGHAAPRPSAQTRIDVLKRGGDSARAWLARLDLTADTMKSSGYRGGGALDPQDLWTLVEDPDADADLRTAAARILARSQEGARVRIAPLVAAVRDDGDQQMMRIALSESEAAGDEIEALEVRRMRGVVRGTIG